MSRVGRFLALTIGVVAALCNVGQAGAAILSIDLMSLVSTNIGLFGGQVNNNTRTTTQLSGTGFASVNSSSQRWRNFFLAYDANYDTMIQSDLSSLAGTTINSATLSFEIDSGDSGTRSVQVRSFDATGTWGGGAISDPPAGTISTSSYTLKGLDENSGLNSWDVTSFVSNRVNTGEDWLGLYISAPTNWSAFTYVGADLDAASVDLVIDYTAVPEPATLTLLGLGVACVGAMRRRKRQA